MSGSEEDFLVDMPKITCRYCLPSRALYCRGNPFVRSRIVHRAVVGFICTVQALLNVTEAIYKTRNCHVFSGILYKDSVKSQSGHCGVNCASWRLLVKGCMEFNTKLEELSRL